MAVQLPQRLDRTVMNRNRNTQIGPHALTQLEPEPNASAQEPELSDPTALPPTNGSTLSEALANDAEPSLAASGESHSAAATPLGVPAPQALSRRWKSVCAASKTP